jgi:hypothetical protein
MQHDFTLNDVEWAAKECERQQTGPIEVWNLCRGIQYARSMVRIESLDIRCLGYLIEPQKNSMYWYRRVPVYFRDFENALDPDKIESAINSLLTHGSDLSPIDWYKEFELIHPFLDGNGRVGALLYNYLSGTLDDLQTPPDIFGKEI